MRTRFAFGVFLNVILLVCFCYAQITGDVVISNASLNDGYGASSCGADGQLYRYHGGRSSSIMRLSRDGSTLLFLLPDKVWPAAIAPAGAGLNILGSQYSREQGQVYEMYHFDSQANLLSHHPVHMTFFPTQMAVTSSGRTIVLGHHPKDFAQQDDWKFGGAIMDADDQLTRGFDLPLPPGGGGWTYSSPVVGGDGAAYVILHSNTGPQTAIATISEAGNTILHIKTIPIPPDSDQRHHNLWLFGPGVAVDQYIHPGERPGKDRFDEYDLASGAKVRTRVAAPQGFQPGCYLGDEFSMLAHSAHVDPARYLSPDTLRLVTVKLQDEPTTADH